MELRVKEVCKKKGLLMEDLASRLGITRITLTRNINGNPTLSTLEKIADALSVSVVELFEAKREGFMALVDNAGELRRFDTIEALRAYIDAIEGGSSPLQAL